MKFRSNLLMCGTRKQKRFHHKETRAEKTLCGSWPASFAHSIVHDRWLLQTITLIPRICFCKRVCSTSRVSITATSNGNSLRNAGAGNLSSLLNQLQYLKHVVITTC